LDRAQAAHVHAQMKTCAANSTAGVAAHRPQVCRGDQLRVYQLLFRVAHEHSLKVHTSGV